MRISDLLWTVTFSLSLFSGFIPRSEACSDAFVSSGGQKVSARNLDWGTQEPMLVTISPRGVCRKSVPVKPGDQPVSWVSQYGTVVARMYSFGAYMPVDGMNEYGLSGGLLMMMGAKYPALDSRPSLSDVFWLFYFLDNCRTVAEAVDLAPGVRVDCVVPQHLVLHDPSGDTAVMEYVNGQLNIYRPPQYNGVMTNEPPYPDQLANLLNYEGFGGTLPLPGGVASESRFVRASWYHQTLPVPETSEQAIGSVLAIMQNIAKPLVPGVSHTLWTAVHDHSALRYYWRSFYHPDLRYVDLNTIDVSAGNPVRVLDLYADLVGDVGEYFKPDPSQRMMTTGDYDGDGTSDIAIFRALSGMWAVRGITRIYFGGSDDLTVPGDYNGDGTTDIGVYRGVSALWAIRNLSRAYFGGSSGRPVPEDYNGDGCCDIAVFREASGLWAIKNITRTYMGSLGDFPVPGDYNGDGTMDIGVFRVSNGLWAVKDISRFYYGNIFATAGAGDYNGDGTCQAAVYGPPTYDAMDSRWAIRGLTVMTYGLVTDLPVPDDYTGDGAVRPAVFREDAGLWAVHGFTRCYFGSRYDLPAGREQGKTLTIDSK